MLHPHMCRLDAGDSMSTKTKIKTIDGARDSWSRPVDELAIAQLSTSLCACCRAEYRCHDEQHGLVKKV